MNYEDLHAHSSTVNSASSNVRGVFGLVMVQCDWTIMKVGVGVTEVLLGSNGVALTEWLAVAMVTSTEWVGGAV